MSIVGIMAETPRIYSPSGGRDEPTHKWTFWRDRHKSYCLQTMYSLYSWPACSWLCKDHGWIWNESSLGRGSISSTGDRNMATSLFLCISYTIQYSIFWILLVIIIYSFLTISVFNQALKKIQLASHICSLAELLRANTMQQLELALLGSPTAKVLDVLVMATQSHTTFTCPSSMSLHLTTPPLHQFHLPQYQYLG